MEYSLSPYLIAILVSWLTAQGAKYIVVAAKNKTLRAFRQIYLSGNMPSAHSAAAVSVATLIGLTSGLNSALFGLAVAFTGVVMYDAMMVRRSVGEQGRAIQELIHSTKSDVKIPRAAKGHTPVEVLVGAFLGVLIGYVVFIATK